LEKREVEQILTKLKQNMKDWDQTTASILALLQANDQLLTQLQETESNLSAQQKVVLQQVMSEYQSLMQVAAKEKKKVLQQLKSLDRQKSSRGGTYHQKITDGTMIELEY
jgi:dsDNA-specific endonuclease/ATPase MutS2